MRGCGFRSLSCLALFALIALQNNWASATSPEPLAQAHAHNDYLHERPLLDALSHGFASVEADIFLVDGQLLVAHTKRDLKPERTLEALYLDPLRQRVKAGGGSVFPGGGTFTLLIDIKSAAEPTYARLAQVLAQYADILSVVRDGKPTTKAVTVIISGDRPRETLAAQRVRYAGLDGRLSDLDSDLPVDLLPLLSDNWAQHFKWKGRGAISDGERAKLVDAVKRAHARGRRIRFWATPETVEAWRELQAAGVDMINTDDLAGLEKFLRSAAKSN
jgi:glycerophosphoryl diester phosphodiesterase family protein